MRGDSEFPRKTVPPRGRTIFRSPTGEMVLTLDGRISEDTHVLSRSEMRLK